MEFSYEFSTIDCYSCSFLFAVKTTWDNKRRSDHKIFYCPSCGQGQSYCGKTKEQKLIEKNKRLKERLSNEQQCCISARSEANMLEKRMFGYKGYATRLKNKLSDAEQPEVT